MIFCEKEGTKEREDCLFSVIDNKISRSEVLFAPTCNNVAKNISKFSFAVRIKNNAEPDAMGLASRCEEVAKKMPAKSF